jgi:branched-chain amino acid transport system substrate-binding protein
VSTTTTPQRLRATLRAAAVVAATALLVSGCTVAAEPEPAPSPTPTKQLTLQVGALLPQTGGMAAYAPAMQAAFDLAVDDVNEARLGLTIEAEVRDSGDSTTDVSVTSLTELLELRSSVIVGPLTDGVSRKVIDQAVNAGSLMISPGSTSPDFGAYADKNLYWRTSPSCEQEGLPLGAAAGEHGHESLGIIAQADLCGPGLPLAVSAGFKGTGGHIAISKSFDPTTALDPLIAEIVQKKPDAVAVLATGSAVSIATALIAAGYAADQLYFSGIAIDSHAADFAAGTFAGAHATRPGLDLSRLEDFTDRLLELDPAITDFSFAAETYDAVIVAALASIAAQSVRGADIAERMREVSGGVGSGERATTFAEAAGIIREGRTVDYDGPSGTIAFDAEGDAAGAVIGLYEYQNDDTFRRIG